MKDLLHSLRLFFFMTLLLGVAYPVVVTVAGQALFPRQASGGLIEQNGHLIGAELIAQKFESPKYFWPRPSAVDYNPLPSGGSNLGPTSADLVKARSDRRAKAGADAPEQLLAASGSGLDPHISPEAARYQIARVAHARGVSPEVIEKLVHDEAHGRQLGLFGEPTVNVLRLNLALDRL